MKLFKTDRGGFIKHMPNATVFDDLFFLIKRNVYITAGVHMNIIVLPEKKLRGGLYWNQTVCSSVRAIISGLRGKDTRSFEVYVEIISMVNHLSLP